METRDVKERATKQSCTQFMHENAGGCLLTEALRDLPAPRPISLAGQHGRQGELIPLQAGIAHTGAPDEVRAHHFPIGNGLWGFAGDS